MSVISNDGAPLYYLSHRGFCDLERTKQYQQKMLIKDDKISMFDVIVESPMGAAILK